MKTIYRTFAILGIAWAVLIHLFLFVQAIRDEQTRKISDLEATTSLWIGPDRVTNGAVSLSEDYAKLYVRRIHEIAEAHSRRSVTYWVINWVSSAVIIILCICLLKTNKKHEKPVA